MKLASGCIAIARKRTQGAHLLAACLVAGLQIPAFADDAGGALGRTLKMRCGPEECVWLSAERRTQTDATPKGRFFEIRTRDWSTFAAHRTLRRPIPVPGENATSYVWCSTSAPAIVFRAGQEARKWISYPLAPDDPAGLRPWNRASYIVYFAVCHDSIMENPETEMAALARRLAYHTNQDTLAPQEVERPQDVIERLAK